MKTAHLVILSKCGVSKDLRTVYLLSSSDSAKISPHGYALAGMTGWHPGNGKEKSETPFANIQTDNRQGKYRK